MDFCKTFGILEKIFFWDLEKDMKKWKLKSEIGIKNWNLKLILKLKFEMENWESKIENEIRIRTQKRNWKSNLKIDIESGRLKLEF